MRDNLEVTRRFSGLTDCGCVAMAYIGHGTRGWGLVIMASGEDHDHALILPPVWFDTETDAIASLEGEGWDAHWIEAEDND